MEKLNKKFTIKYYCNDMIKKWGKHFLFFFWIHFSSSILVIIQIITSFLVYDSRIYHWMKLPPCLLSSFLLWTLYTGLIENIELESQSIFDLLFFFCSSVVLVQTKVFSWLRYDWQKKCLCLTKIDSFSHMQFRENLNGKWFSV